ncbi:ABC transporter substrate-binding protein [Paenibacillus methanolicus]|uniref:Multiple sugar transport system substrate-binding protein n=1 Tax=Paenibacillus methanolicus TaxID=582686 RepID=A0A5S5CHM4_9BACL|nr:extracellular solute-binding protein [Paenibacillus methanolicus]TYP79222.1 multiple sugar transport system substrate-binding protein [Paenibacillus methanolicus]
MKRTKRWTCFILGVALLAGFAAVFGFKSASDSFSAYSPIPAAAKEIETTSGDAEGELRILAAIEAQDWIVAEYEKRYPNRKIAWEYATGEDFVHRLAADPVPDLIIADNNQANSLVALDLFEDLGQAPYSAAARIQNEWFKGLTLSPFRSMDGNSLIAVPKDYPLQGTFYRADILARYGFPSEPEALASFMEDPANWLRMAETLQAEGHSIVSYGVDILNIGAAGKGYFTPQGSFTRNSPEIKSVASAMMEAERKQLPSNLNMWDEIGRQAIRDGRLIMLYMGEWGWDQLKEWAPGQESRWAFTRLPFQAYGIHGGSFFSILKNSGKKTAAWDYIRLSMELETDYRVNRPGWQWMSEVPDYWPSPLAGEAEAIWNKELQASRPAGITANQWLNAIEARMMEQLDGDLQILRDVVYP